MVDVASPWIPGRRLWQQGQRRRAIAHVAVALLTLLLIALCAWRSPGTATGSRWEQLLVVVALLLCPLIVLRLLSWSVLIEGEGGALWRQLTRNRPAFLGFLLVGVLSFVAAMAPVLTPHDPIAFSDMLSTRYQTPGGDFLLGSDQFGRDVLTRLLYGARVSLGVAFMAVTLTMFW